MLKFMFDVKIKGRFCNRGVFFQVISFIIEVTNTSKFYE